MKNNKLIVAYVCDEHYIPYLKISMDSIRRYNKNVEFAILSTKQFEVDGAKVFTINADNSNFKFNKNDRMHDGVYYKFWLPTLPYDKVLYIDCDVVCQRPLNSLWDMKIDFIGCTQSHSFGKKQAKELGFEKYFLTGMMLMNLDKLRKENFTEQCLDLLKKLPQVNQHDETVINKLFNKRITEIDRKYNYCHNRKYDNPISETDAYLLHFVGGPDQKIEMLMRDNFNGLAKLKEVLSGKRVAIVGNSETILKKEQGAEIDSHDIVIRFNKGFPSDKVGNKTDVVFFACSLTPEELNKYGNVYKVKRSPICKHRCDFSLSTRDRVQLEQKLIPSVRHNMLTAKSSQPSTGFIAVNFALSCDCESIDLYGFDFFETPTYYNAKGYVPLHNGSDEKDKILEYKSCGLLNIF